MPRPLKAGLTYFSKDIDYYDDLKIIDLLNEYGPLGQTIYDVLLCMIYREGYYLEASPEKLAGTIIRIIGNRWIKDKQTVVQVIHYCANIGLLHNDLLQQNVITSVGLQRRYAEVVKRRRFQGEKYWLLEKKSDEPLLSTSQNEVIATETGVVTAETGVNVYNNATKESKGKKSKGNNSRVEVGQRPTPASVATKIVDSALARGYQPKQHQDSARIVSGDPPPASAAAIIDFITEQKLPFSSEKAEYFFRYYQANDWKDKKGRPIHWKQKLVEWAHREKQDKDGTGAGEAPSYDLEAFKKLGFDLPEIDDTDIP